jgi:23S rRNA (cytosine1962-C5)-methyltransferase
MVKVYLKENRDKPIKNGHPWVFSGAIEKVHGEGTAGEPCEVIGTGGAVLGHGYYNAKSSITVRMLTKGNSPFTPEMLRERLARAIAARAPVLADGGTDSCRLVNAEGDFLPGLIVDRFAGGLSMQICTAGMERMRGGIIAALTRFCTPAFIFERSDTEAREREGLPALDGLAEGALPDPLIVRENGLRFSADLAGGQKTGFYFDQRENRLLARTFADGKVCLDCFSYSGAFSCNMLAAGAKAVTSVDSSKNAVRWCGQSVALNGLDASRSRQVCADVFDFLRESGERYECIVLDPPKFAKHPSEVPKASRGYKDINLLAMKKTVTGGIIMTFSCSNAIDPRLFRQIVFAAAADSGRDVQLLRVCTAGPDHPVSLAHPEGEYLKGLVLKIC